MRSGLRLEPDRAKAIGRMLFQKYDLAKKGALQPNQCFQIFSDFCYRVLNISQPPTIDESESMHQILDANRDKRVTESDFENLALRYLCGQSSTNRFETHTNTKATRGVNGRKLTRMAVNQMETVEKFFEMFIRDNSGLLAEVQIPSVLEEVYREMGQLSSMPSQKEIESFVQMADMNRKRSTDRNSQRLFSLDEFKQVLLLSLEKGGFKVYE